MSERPDNTDRNPATSWDAEFEALIQSAMAGEFDDSDGSVGAIDASDAALLRRTAEVAAASAAATTTEPLPPASLRTGVLEAIRAEAAGRAIAPEAAATSAGPAIAAAGQSRWRSRRPFAAVVAAVAFAVAALFTLTPGGGGSVAFATELIPAPNSPSPGATGTAQLVRTKGGGWVMRLKVKGLAPNPTGSVYQCWYVGTADGTAADGTEKQDRISVGTFRTKDGSIVVEWPTAADPKRYPKVGITLEPNDGNPLRSGPKVLVGATSAKAP